MAWWLIWCSVKLGCCYIDARLSGLVAMVMLRGCQKELSGSVLQHDGQRQRKALNGIDSSRMAIAQKTVTYITSICTGYCERQQAWLNMLQESICTKCIQSSASK